MLRQAVVPRALVFGLCGLLGWVTIFPFTLAAFREYILLFLGYSGIFFGVMIFSSYRRKAPTSAHTQEPPAQLRVPPTLWPLWVGITIVWLVIQASGILYPAFVSGIYRVTDPDMIDGMTFPAMPPYMHGESVQIGLLVVIVAISVAYYPVTWYTLVDLLYHTRRSDWTRTRVQRYSFITMSLLPFLCYPLTTRILLWLTG
jgi:hypothetical protein